MVTCVNLPKKHQAKRVNSRQMFSKHQFLWSPKKITNWVKWKTMWCKRKNFNHHTHKLFRSVGRYLSLGIHAVPSRQGCRRCFDQRTIPMDLWRPPRTRRHPVEEKFGEQNFWVFSEMRQRFWYIDRARKMRNRELKTQNSSQAFIFAKSYFRDKFFFHQNLDFVLGTTWIRSAQFRPRVMR